MPCLLFDFHTVTAAEEAASMGYTKPRHTKPKRPKTVLRLLDLEHSKSAVLNSLAAVSSQESYGHAIDEFRTWYCSEPRLSLSRTVVLRYRIYLEQRNLSASTINVGLARIGVWLMNRRIMDFLAQNWPPAFEESKEPSASVSESETGSASSKRVLY